MTGDGHGFCTCQNMLMVHTTEVWQLGGDAHMFDGTPCSRRVESTGWPPVPDVDKLQAALERDEFLIHEMRGGVHADRIERVVFHEERIDPEHVDNLGRLLDDIEQTHKVFEDQINPEYSEKPCKPFIADRGISAADGYKPSAEERQQAADELTRETQDMGFGYQKEEQGE